MRDVYLLLNRHYLLASIFIIIQQLIVASSTYFIAKLGEQFGNGVLNIHFIIAFIVSLIIVYVPAYFSVIYLEKGKYTAWQNYIAKFNAHFLGKSTLFNNHTLKQSTTALISQESKDTIDDMSNTLFDLLALILNVVFNIIVIAFVLDKAILLAYGIGMVLSFGLVYLLNNKIDKTATTAQNARLDLIGKLHHSFDNVVLNNAYNYKLFKNQIDSQFIKTTTDNITAEKLRYLSATLGMIVLMLPVLGISFYLFKQHWHNNVILAILIAALPRQVQLLQMCYTLISYHIGIAMIRARIKGLFEIFKNNNFDLMPFIQYDNIKVLQTGLAFDKDNLPKTGRMTLIGQNGVGKSSLLLTLKQKFGDTAYYLPIKHQLCFDNKDTHQGSSGQQLIRQLSELKSELSGIKILLLDEWDAHLDDKNRKKADKLITKWQGVALVVEVRHRQA
ncbi:MAG: AAA family ATPase [Moraxella sp.]|nr:AAA family ATPase [Moraxella sp.]